jgi:pantoate kinase
MSIEIKKRDLQIMFNVDQLSIGQIAKHYGILYDETKEVFRYYNMSIPKNQEKNPNPDEIKLVVLQNIANELGTNSEKLNEVIEKYSIKISKNNYENTLFNNIFVEDNNQELIKLEINKNQIKQIA